MKKRLLSILLALTLLLGAVPVNALAAGGKGKGQISVRLTVLGDTLHEMAEGDNGHGLWLGGLSEWLPETGYAVDSGDTVWALLSKAFEEDGALTLFSRFNESYNSEYIYAVQKDDVKLEEKDNCENSGWMVAVNGVHTNVGVSLVTLKDGDSVILHWCDDFWKDEDTGAQQAFANQRAAYAAEDLIAAIGEVTRESGEAITAAREAYDALTAVQKALVTNYSVLAAAEKRFAELKLAEEKPAVKVSYAVNGRITLTWEPLESAAEYQVYVSAKKSGGYKLAATVTKTKYTYAGKADTTYYFKLRAVSEGGVKSRYSDAKSGVQKLAQPKSLKAASKNKQVTLTWKKVSGAEKYAIYVSANGTSGWKKAGTSAGVKFIYKKGSPGKTLYFRVCAVSPKGRAGVYSETVSCKVKK